MTLVLKHCIAYLLYLESGEKNFSQQSNIIFGLFIVERRRRDKINNWIVQLSKTIPDCTLDATKTGQVGFGLSGSSLQVTGNGGSMMPFSPL